MAREFRRGGGDGGARQQAAQHDVLAGGVVARPVEGIGGGCLPHVQGGLDGGAPDFLGRLKFGVEPVDKPLGFLAACRTEFFLCRAVQFRRCARGGHQPAMAA